jgi:TRAP-type C4-dicarboxylate transport system permease small subunit
LSTPRAAEAGSPPPAPRGGGPLVAAADWIDRLIGLVCRVVILVTVVILLAVLGANVIARYIFAHGGVEWVSEVPEQLFPWLIAAGIVLAVQHGAHIAVDILLQSLGRGGRRFLIVAIGVIVAAAYLVLLQVSLQVAEIAAMERSAILQLPRSLGYYAMAAASVLVALCSLTIALRVAMLGPEAAPEPNPEESVT